MNRHRRFLCILIVSAICIATMATAVIFRRSTPASDPSGGKTSLEQRDSTGPVSAPEKQKPSPEKAEGKVSEPTATQTSATKDAETQPAAAETTASPAESQATAPSHEPPAQSDPPETTGATPPPSNTNPIPTSPAAQGPSGLTQDQVTGNLPQFPYLTAPEPDTPEHTHEYWMERSEPICYLVGYDFHQCPCGSTYLDNFVSSPDHDFQFDRVIPPQRGIPGRTVYTCTICGDFYETDYVDALPLLDLDWVRQQAYDYAAAYGFQLTWSAPEYSNIPSNWSGYGDWVENNGCESALLAQAKSLIDYQYSYANDLGGAPLYFIYIDIWFNQNSDFATVGGCYGIQVCFS